VQTVEGAGKINLDTGRYVVECNLLGTSDDTAWLRLVDANTGEVEAMFETSLYWLKHHTNSALVIDLTEAKTLLVEVGSPEPIENLGLAGADVYKVVEHYA
jgi:hypothetical protein